MTDEQVQNWRKILCLSLGPYALIMPKEQIEKIRNNMQSWADNANIELTTYECLACNTKFKGSEMLLLEVDPKDLIPEATPMSINGKQYYQVCPKCKGVFET